MQKDRRRDIFIDHNTPLPILGEQYKAWEESPAGRAFKEEYRRREEAKRQFKVFQKQVEERVNTFKYHGDKTVLEQSSYSQPLFGHNEYVVERNGIFVPVDYFLQELVNAEILQRAEERKSFSEETGTISHEEDLVLAVFSASNGPAVMTYTHTSSGKRGSSLGIRHGIQQIRIENNPPVSEQETIFDNRLLREQDARVGYIWKFRNRNLSFKAVGPRP